MELADILVRAGFTREDPVDQHGEFSIRGGVADIFPAGDRLPVRLEFIGDTIESIRQFDPATQRSVAALDRVTVAPVRETADTLEGREAERPATFFSYLGRASRLRLFVSEFDKVREAGDRRFTTLLDSYQDALAREERVLPPAKLMLPWPDVMSMLPSATKLETFAADTDMIDGAADSHRRGARDGGRPLRVVSAGADVSRPRPRVGRRAARRARAGRDVGARGRDRGPRGTRDRDPARLRRRRGRHQPRRGHVRQRAARHDRSAHAGVPASRREDAAVCRDRHLRRGARRPPAPRLGRQGVPLGLPRPQGRRPRRPRRQRHRRLRRAEADQRRPRDARVHGTALRRRRQALRPRRPARPGAEVLGQRPPDARSPRRRDVGEGQVARQEGDARHGRRAAQALCRAQGRPGPRLPAGHALAGGVRGRLPVRAHARPGQRRHRHQARHGVADADGSVAVWRRRLWQDGSGDARRLQGGHGRQAGGRAGADDGARAAAPEDAAHALCGVSGAHRHGQPIPQQGRAGRVAEEPARGQAGHPRRHASPARQGRRVQGPRDCSSSTRSSGSASRTRSASSRCASASTCSR